MLHIPDQFEYISFSKMNGAENMSLDEAIFNSVKKEKRQGVFRLYGWKTPTITIGFFQKSKSIHLQRCREQQIPVVRRITGGRAVYHHHEITYSICLRGDKNLSNKKKIFAQLSEIIINGLTAIGMEGQVNTQTVGSPKNPNCFQTTSVCEIINPQGMKLVGSALLIQDDTVLMQGSIPLNDSYKNLSYYLANSNDGAIDNRNLNSNKENELVDLFIRGIKKSMQLQPSTVDSEEDAMIHQLLQDKYLNDQWTFRR